MKKNTKSKNKILYIDMDGTLTEFRHKDKVTIDDWEDKDIFAYPEICTSTIIGICDKIHMKEEPFNKIDKIYIITQVPYTNYTHHCKNKKETGKHPGQRRQALTGVLLLASCTQLWYTCSA